MLVKRFLVEVCISSAARKEKAVDRGGPIWPPPSHLKDDRTAPKKKAFDRGGPFTRLDQMLRTTIYGGGKAPHTPCWAIGF